MYRLILDRGIASVYTNAVAPSIGANPDKLHAPFYPFLRKYSRTLEDSIFGDSVLPVKMLVTIRTDRSNEVLVPDDGKFYTDCTSSYPNEHPLDDTVILAGKTIVDKLFDCGENLAEVIRRTTIYPVGGCILDDQAYVYTHVVIDHTLKNSEIFNVKGCHFEHITSLSATNHLEEELLKSLILVKGESENA